MIRRFTRRAMESFPFPVVVVDRGGYIVSVNRAAVRETNSMPPDAIGGHFTDIFYHGRLLDRRNQFLSPLMDTLVREREIITHKLIIETDLHRRPVSELVTTWLLRDRDQRIEMVWGLFCPTDLSRALEVRNMRTLHCFSAAIGERDPYTRGHLERVAIYALSIGQALDLPRKSLSELFVAAITHDIGKIALPPAILNKPGRLAAAEMAVIRQHSQFSANILNNFEMPAEVVRAVLYHHERYDGVGYPAGLRGDEIPLLARILAVADSFEAMTSARVYRPALSNQAALEELARNAGAQFDPLVVKRTLELVQAMDIAACKGHDECIAGRMCSRCPA